MSELVRIAELEGEEPSELLLEDDGSLPLSTLTLGFPGSCGLIYHSPESNAIQGVPLVDGIFHPPENGWGDCVYYCVFRKEKKRKPEDRLELYAPPAKRFEEMSPICSELTVTHLPCKLTQHEFREYFSIFGSLDVAELKNCDSFDNSNVFGVIRYHDYESQMRVLAQCHVISGRNCLVKISTRNENQVLRVPNTVYVSRVPEDMQLSDLGKYFSMYGEVTSVYIPKQFRGFAFVTFRDPNIAETLVGGIHVIKGASVNVRMAERKIETYLPMQRAHPLAGPGLLSIPFGGGENQNNYHEHLTNTGMNNHALYPKGMWLPFRKM